MTTYQIIRVQNNEQLNRFCAAPGLPPLDPRAVSRSRPDAQWLLANQQGDLVGRCSLWWGAAPLYREHRLGLVGHYGAGRIDAGAYVLARACDHLAKQGCTLAVGPMDGNTWQRYRLLTERGSEPLFFLEPDNPDEWPVHFTGSGFFPLAHYFSALKTELGGPDARLARVAARAAERGIEIRALRLDRFEAELGHIYQIVLASFSRNFLYTPINEADFMAQYLPLRPYIRPELVLLAERNGQPIGFIFALPDWLQAQAAHSGKSEARPGTDQPEGQAIDTVILKTVAVRPDHRTGGLGSLLVARCQEMAHSLGYRCAIHALMHETNSSRKISERSGARIIRRYTLFARELGKI